MLIAGSNGNTRNLEVLEVACVFIRIEAMFFSTSQYRPMLCSTKHVTLAVTATFN